MPRKKEIEIVLDTETTGLDYTRERIIEFAGVRLENGKVKDEFQTLELTMGYFMGHRFYINDTQIEIDPSEYDGGKKTLVLTKVQ